MILNGDDFITVCGRCKKPLSNEYSVSIGFGPTCAKLEGIRYGSRGSTYTSERPVDRISGFLNNPVVKPILIRALLTGLTVVNPAVGGAANLAYTSYSYYKTGRTMWTAYQSWENQRIHASKESAQSVAGDITGYATSSYADQGARYMVNEAEKGGIIKEITQKTNIEEPVWSRFRQQGCRNN